MSAAAKVVSEKEVSIDDIVNEATEIWHELRRRKINPSDYAAGEAFFNEMCKKHPEFSKSYSLVLRYIAEMQVYSAKVFRNWLKQVQVRPWKSADEYFETQANYIMMLYSHYNPRASTRDKYAVRNNTKKMLSQEYDYFKNTTKKYEKIVNEHDEKLAAKNKADLLEYCKQAPKSELALAGTFRAEVDETLVNLPVKTSETKVAADPIVEITSADLLL